MKKANTCIKVSLRFEWHKDPQAIGCWWQPGAVKLWQSKLFGVSSFAGALREPVQTQEEHTYKLHAERPNPSFIALMLK